METWKRALMLIITVTITTWFEIEGCKFKKRHSLDRLNKWYVIP